MRCKLRLPLLLRDRPRRAPEHANQPATQKRHEAGVAAEPCGANFDFHFPYEVARVERRSTPSARRIGTSVMRQVSRPEPCGANFPFPYPPRTRPRRTPPPPTTRPHAHNRDHPSVPTRPTPLQLPLPFRGRPRRAQEHATSPPHAHKRHEAGVAAEPCGANFDFHFP